MANFVIHVFLRYGRGMAAGAVETPGGGLKRGRDAARFGVDRFAWTAGEAAWASDRGSRGPPPIRSSERRSAVAVGTGSPEIF